MGDLVLAYGAPPLPFGSVDEPSEFGAYALYVGTDALNLGAHEGLHYLLAVSPFDPGAELEFTGPPLPFGDVGDGTLLSWIVRGVASTRYPAATTSRSTVPGDLPSNLWVPGALLGRINFNVDLFDGADPLTTGQAGTGVLRIADPGGDLDDLLSLGWDGAAIALKRGNEDELFRNWPSVASLTSSQMLSTSREKELNLRDLAWALRTADLHGQIYTGTGGLEGDPAWTGKPKPYAAGYASNVSPPQIGAVLLCYQVSYTSVRAIPGVRDSGIPLTPTVDYPTYEALAAVTIAGGTFATCKAAGVFRLGSQPVGDVTCDVVGDDDTIDGQSFPHTRGQIVRRIVTRLGVIRLSEANQFDFPALTAFESLQPAPVGWWWMEAKSKSDALDEIMRGCMGWWMVRIDGRFALGQVDEPSDGAPDFSLSYPAPDSGEVRLGEPVIAAVLPPRRGTFIGYARNYTVQAPSQLALGLSSAEIQAFGQATRYATAVDQWTANAYPTSALVVIDAGYRDEVDAIAEARRQQRIWSRSRTLYQIPATIDPFADVVGRRCRIANGNRLGLGATRQLLCCGIDAAETPTLTLKFWG